MATSRMPQEHRPPADRRRGRAAVLATVAVLAISAVGVTIAGLGGAATSAGQPRAAGDVVSAADLRTLVSPTSWEDIPGHVGLFAFQFGVNDRAIGSCLTERGHADSVPSASAPAFAATDHYRYFEDPAVLVQAAFGVMAARDRTGGRAPASMPKMPPTEVLQACVREGDAAVAPLTSLVGGLREEWMDRVRALEQGDAVQAAWGKWRDCVRATGHEVDDELGFYGIVDSTLQRLLDAGRNDEARSTELALAKDFATCLQPVVEARAQVRAEARDAFWADRDAHGLAQRVTEAIAEMEATSGVSYR